MTGAKQPLTKCWMNECPAFKSGVRLWSQTWVESSLCFGQALIPISQWEVNANDSASVWRNCEDQIGYACKMLDTSLHLVVAQCCYHEAYNKHLLYDWLDWCISCWRFIAATAWTLRITGKASDLSDPNLKIPLSLLSPISFIWLGQRYGFDQYSISMAALEVRTKPGDNGRACTWGSPGEETLKVFVSLEAPWRQAPKLLCGLLSIQT